MSDERIDQDTERAWVDFIVRQHHQLGGVATATSAMAQCAQQLLRAVLAGDSCVPIERDLPVSPVLTVITPTRANAVVTTPLVQDLGHVYLQRLWQAETILAARLRSLVCATPIADQATISTVLGELTQRVQLAPEQLRAVAVALNRSLLVLTGGPGTGKTHTIASVIAATRQARPGLRLALAAPTGKAAARLAESLSQQNLAVPAVSTVHALLGFSGDHGDGRSRRLLDIDLLIIDEASMLGLELACSVMQALPAHARLILAGDGEQLSSVEPGSVFADVISAGEHLLADSMVRLTKNFRQAQAPGLAALAQLLRQDDPVMTQPSLPGVTVQDVDQRETPTVRERRRQIVADAARRYQSLLAGAIDPWSQLTRSDGFRLLTALREGPLGALELAEAIDRVMAPEPLALWYPGRLIIVLRNARDLGLANGDIGVACVRDGQLGVAFGNTQRQQWIAIAQLPAHEPAWALTVHKAQGSEYDEIAFVPAPPEHPLSRRELVYTAVTRAKRAVFIWGGWPALRDAAARPMARRGTLALRLRSDFARV